MSSPSFGLPGTSNNAPPPPAGNWNSTGTNNGVGFGGGSYPNYPMFGAPSSGVVSPSSNLPLFGGANSGLDSLFSNPLADYYNNTGFWNQIGKAYGVGTSQALQTEFGQLFNPQTVAAFLNAMQPGVQQGLASTENAFGDEGSRFGSAASLGIGNYESQVNLNEQQTVASMYENAVNQEIGLTSSLLPTLHQERADSGSWIHDLVGGLEIAGSIAGAPFTGGASLMGLGGGISELNSGINGGSPSATTGGSISPLLMNNGMGGGMSGIPGLGGNTGTFGMGAPSYNSNSNQFQELLDWSAGADLGGSSYSSADANMLF
jgi:hypothetical protein